VTINHKRRNVTNVAGNESLLIVLARDKKPGTEIREDLEHV
jgi:hypothetical protein